MYPSRERRFKRKYSTHLSVEGPQRLRGVTCVPTLRTSSKARGYMSILKLHSVSFGAIKYSEIY